MGTNAGNGLALKKRGPSGIHRTNRRILVGVCGHAGSFADVGALRCYSGSLSLSPWCPLRLALETRQWASCFEMMSTTVYHGSPHRLTAFATL